jgi:hypothetical protein
MGFSHDLFLREPRYQSAFTISELLTTFASRTQVAPSEEVVSPPMF